MDCLRKPWHSRRKDWTHPLRLRLFFFQHHNRRRGMRLEWLVFCCEKISLVYYILWLWSPASLDYSLPHCSRVQVTWQPRWKLQGWELQGLICCSLVVNFCDIGKKHKFLGDVERADTRHPIVNRVFHSHALLLSSPFSFRWRSSDPLDPTCLFIVSVSWFCQPWNFAWIDRHQLSPFIKINSTDCSNRKYKLWLDNKNNQRRASSTNMSMYGVKALLFYTTTTLTFFFTYIYNNSATTIINNNKSSSAIS